ncbi:4-hydroxythreonine-4-phosphate dehydrogenase PdxA [Ichthyobacterium seriolicida]|uniref:4-hydroxythreonine-4-phosphate dehydrogenase n=1 Tax=Ichthyobacterium seriolicida TaxID=242600 RepID=A0A1J1EAG5_9FLAO|nr:4-hydroxythreonine-4-phosphate dehydrogenase PdxA [Ichthyobacterium seriolicida]BAV94504.1 4-hydroxythreonine-4-phosphate dehydrogenase [Ichthyobacterium seriolicida]
MISNKKKIRVGISTGDINGIGLEVFLKTFSNADMLSICTPVLFSSSDVLCKYMKKINMEEIPINKIYNPSQIGDNKLNILAKNHDDNISIQLGTPTQISGQCALESLESATASLKNKDIDVLVTAPISKKNISSSGFDFVGHTEYLEHELEGESLMFMVSDYIRLAVVTGHIPISEVDKNITEEILSKKLNIMIKSLKRDFGISNPKIAVLGLNPHCGDQGIIGEKDDSVIKPVIKNFYENRKLVFGPFSADSFFIRGNHMKYDAVLSMYHDQGLMPFKMLSTDEGVNFTAGLERTRTSPDHGTAFGIAGQGIANENSFRKAVFLAVDIFKKNNIYKELYS